MFSLVSQLENKKSLVEVPGGSPWQKSLVETKGHDS